MCHRPYSKERISTKEGKPAKTPMPPETISVSFKHKPLTLMALQALYIAPISIQQP